tara:strand:+ start:26 stop:646 length:621 start_codon:yes stop_codon:yes gene_type:complete
MTKPFNIHDWQAKQAKQRLTENDEYQKRQDALTPGKNPDAFYGDGSLDKLRQKSQGNNSFGSAGTDKRSGQVIGDILQLIKSTGVDPMDIMDEIAQEFNIGAPDTTRYGSEMPGPSRALGMEEIDKMDIHREEGIKKGKMVHLDPYFTEIRKMKLGDGTVNVGRALIDLVPGNLEEMSTTGTGASFNAGSGEGYMSPNAFKKKKKK